MIENVFFDSDLLGDDFFALYALIRNKDIHLCGITSFGRRVRAIERAKMAQVFLDMHNAEPVDIVPGADKPMMLDVRKSCTFCDEQMKWLRNEWDADRRYRSVLLADESAASYLVRKARELRNITLLCTGPLTNIALAILLDSDFASHVKDLYFMGGVHAIQGNSSPVSESNVRNDPEAASIVFRSIPGIHVIPYDITMQVLLTGEEAAAIKDEFFSQTALSCCRSHECRYGGSSIMPMHDYLAYLALADESIISYSNYDISIETSDSICRGMMVLSSPDRLCDMYGIAVDVGKARQHLASDFEVRL